jgi:hypothetical protein
MLQPRPSPRTQKAHHEKPFHIFVSAGRRFQESSSPLTKTIPEWALPGCTLKPDIVLVLGWSEDMPAPQRPTTEIEFIICDVTCGYGHTSTKRILRKQQKYANLIRSLRLRGWAARAATPGSYIPPSANHNASDTDADTPMPQVHDDDDGDHEHPIDSAAQRQQIFSDIFIASFGATGDIYASSAYALRALEIEENAIKCLLASIHLHIVRSTCNILSTRRKLDSLLQQQPASTRRGEG